MLETELELGVCDSRGVDLDFELEGGAGKDAAAITRAEAEWLNGVVVVVVVEEEELDLGVMVGVELLCMAVFVADMSTPTAPLNRVVVALVVRVVLDVVVRGKMEYVAVVVVILAAHLM